MYQVIEITVIGGLCQCSLIHLKPRCIFRCQRDFI